MTVCALQFFPTPQSVGVRILVKEHLDGLESGQDHVQIFQTCLEHVWDMSEYVWNMSKKDQDVSKKYLEHAQTFLEVS